MVKDYVIIDNGRNFNHEEWQAYLQSGAVRGVVPHVHGYFEMTRRERRLALLVMKRVGFTFESLLKTTTRQFASNTIMRGIVNACVSVLRKCSLRWNKGRGRTAGTSATSAPLTANRRSAFWWTGKQIPRAGPQLDTTAA